MASVFVWDLERRAFRAANDELGWTREDARVAIAVLVQSGLAILGGELWWVPEGESAWIGLIPQRERADAVYSWETERLPGEEWQQFVTRCGADSLRKVDAWPGENDLPVDFHGYLLYNFTWASEADRL